MQPDILSFNGAAILRASVRLGLLNDVEGGSSAVSLRYYGMTA